MHPVDEPIEVVAARSEWLAEGRALRHDLCAALGVAPATVEHIGSTSVPGLAAKPVIDLMVGCAETERRAVAEQITDLTGYEYLRGHGAPGREYLRRRTTLPWSNAHVVELNGDLWRDNLALRDFLRSAPEAVQEYAAAKRLAAEGTGWLRAYSAAKADTVVALLERARHWARAQGHARS
ncbi:GrpB family protein [Actinopolymorpha pittospori]|uniref:GrpB-like predicted nucleotidyltransferase (UPF0157 family) n=1 Tax=Actinopolymorpha pittospori TaxID=648752 RepID=A0A927RQR8_9ACTN|nr:GrpB-like predicted nucleotidyltransferase (UPF0157 family) [Actinopolymorpha pittospori]